LRRLFHGAVALAAVPAFVLLGASVASAHEQRHVGAYQFTVGWQHEPTYVGTENAVQLFLHDSRGNPIDDIGSPPTLQVEAVFGTKTSAPLDLEPSFDPDTGLGTRGEFDAPIVPTEAGDYTFHFFGSINGQKVDERFTSGPSTFNTVVDPTGVEFPNSVPSVSELAGLTGRLGPRTDHAASAAAAAESRANSSHSLAVVAVIVGAAGLVLGGGALLLARRRPGGGA
jgi:hypothetical protein